LPSENFALRAQSFGAYDGTPMASRTDLTSRARALLNSRPRTVTLPEIAEALGVSASWLSQFGRGLIPKPGADRVQRLHDYLARR
jgi:transcriptional regulator with XRE-family HTH domain